MLRMSLAIAISGICMASDSKPAANGAKTPDGKESKGSLGWIGDKVSEGMTRVVGPPKPKSTQIR